MTTATGQLPPDFVAAQAQLQQAQANYLQSLQNMWAVLFKHLEDPQKGQAAGGGCCPAPTPPSTKSS